MALGGFHSGRRGLRPTGRARDKIFGLNMGPVARLKFRRPPVELHNPKGTWSAASCQFLGSLHLGNPSYGAGTVPFWPSWLTPHRKGPGQGFRTKYGTGSEFELPTPAGSVTQSKRVMVRCLMLILRHPAPREPFLWCWDDSLRAVLAYAPQEGPGTGFSD